MAGPQQEQLLPAKSGGAGAITLGILLTLASQAFQAVRLILEELLLGKMELHPMEVLGWEGFWGTVLMAIIGMPLAWVIPGSDVGGHEENTIDSLVMLWNDDLLNSVNLLFFWSVVGLNVFGLLVTQVLGSVFRAVMLTARTASVWAVDLVLYKTLPADLNVGEAWMSPASWIQLFGFSLLLAGTIIYAQGSSPAAHDKGEHEPYSSEEEADRPTPIPRTRSISNYRPLYSIYIPNSDRPSEVVLIPTNAAAGVQRSSSLPTNPDALLEEGGGAQEPPRLARGSLPTQLRGRLPTRGSLLNLFSRNTSDGDSITSGDSGDLPAGASPSFYRTLTHRTSWILDKDGHRLRTLPLSEDEEVGSSRGPEGVFADGSRGLKPIPEDALRPSMEASNGAGGAPNAGALPSETETPARRSSGVSRSSSRTREIQWSTPSPSGRSDRSVLGQSPTAEVLLEKRSSSKKAIEPMGALPEDEAERPDSALQTPRPATEQNEATDMFGMDLPTPQRQPNQ
ncbi:hypothetical protein CVIRNUC_009694 [Coccomyxa viridis]|uniref:Uncharacterized protein n=1 Tax=Coccomyxa viridis TaxID=1274662 RepID=A0AAV1IGM6_9CHLO|nr:hypothetical protein CVIRNUC_009694 [Coccomyxa viridis]